MRKAVFLATLTAFIALAGQVQASPFVHSISVQFSERLLVENIPSSVRYVFNREVGRGRVIKAEAGSEGRKYTKFAQIWSGGKLIAEKAVKQTLRPPTPTLFHMGPQGYTTSRGSFSRARVARMESTAYTPDAGRGSRATFRTATGRRASYGVVAVDPRVIPLHTLLFVEGYGFAVAADTGGAIKGNIIDVCLPTNAECRQWGRRHVTVHIFRERLSSKE